MNKFLVLFYLINFLMFSIKYSFLQTQQSQAAINTQKVTTVVQDPKAKLATVVATQKTAAAVTQKAATTVVTKKAAAPSQKKFISFAQWQKLRLKQSQAQKTVTKPVLQVKKTSQQALSKATTIKTTTKTISQVQKIQTTPVQAVSKVPVKILKRAQAQTTLFQQPGIQKTVTHAVPIKRVVAKKQTTKTAQKTAQKTVVVSAINKSSVNTQEETQTIAAEKVPDAKTR
jgi:hypothetical protein